MQFSLSAFGHGHRAAGAGSARDSASAFWTLRRGFLARDHVLVGVVEVVVADDARRRFVALKNREPLGGTIGEKLAEFVLIHVRPVFPCS